MTTTQRPDRAAGCDQDDLIAMIPQMRAFARSLCRDRAQADDLTQDALASAWRRRDSYTCGTNLRAWVFMIVRNQFYSDKRRSWRVTQLDPKVAEETLVAVTNPTAALELDDVRRAMLELSDEQRQALTLIAVAGLAYADAAMICRCAEGTIKSRVSRARQRLTAILARGELVGDPRTPGLAMAAILADADRARLAIAA
jgi:RNA polymerase sigma-70 factor (ECF subfamily)